MYIVGIKSIYTPVQMSGFCHVKKWKKWHQDFTTFSTFNVIYNQYNAIENKQKYFREK